MKGYPSARLCLCGLLTAAACWDCIVCQVLCLAFVLNFRESKSGNILFRSMPNGNCLFSSASLSLVGENSLVHELREMAAVELHVNATYYARHPALKSVYEKSQSVMSGKLFLPIGQCLN